MPCSIFYFIKIVFIYNKYFIFSIKLQCTYNIIFIIIINFFIIYKASRSSWYSSSRCHIQLVY